jgi:predicted O-methyltransferase YrrM
MLNEIHSIITKEKIRSSYILNNYGEIIYNFVRKKRPDNCLEIGVLDGYSTIFIAQALVDNDFGKLNSYDLFENYEYKNSKYNDVKNRLEKLNLDSRVNLKHGDAYSIVENIEKNSLDFVHIDISNDGSVYEWAFEIFLLKLSPGGILILEGGTEERDSVEWMSKYNKPPIQAVIERFKETWNIQVVKDFPGLTIATKKV